MCTPRTGSTLLCELLNSINIFPPFDHPNIQFCDGGFIKKGQAFNEWARLYSSVSEFIAHPPPYSKMIFHQYIEIVGSVPKSKRYNTGWYTSLHDPSFVSKVLLKYNSKYIRSLFPDIKFIHLKREPISHAISLYFARETREYHIYDASSLKEYLEINIPINHSKMLEAYKDALLYNCVWEEFWSGDEDVLVVNYEDLVSDNCKKIQEIVSFLGLDLKVNKCNSNRIYRMTRPEASKFENILSQLVKVSHL